ncbi:MAG: hypothetical protein ACRDJW_22870 [Thermomicrobiales bacterium]
MRHRKRLERLEGMWRRVDAGPAVLVVFPDDWPAADQAALDGDDPAACAAVIKHHTGQRSGRRKRLIAVRRRQEGPQ